MACPALLFRFVAKQCAHGHAIFSIISCAIFRQENSHIAFDKWYITGVHKKRGVIAEYCVNQSGNNIWILKQDAIQLALEGRLHATPVHMKSGTIYLRPEHRNHSFVVIT